MITDKTRAAQLNEILLNMVVQLNSSAAEVQAACPTEEFEAYRHGVATVMWELYDQLLRPLHKTHPDLKPADYPEP